LGLWLAGFLRGGNGKQFGLGSRNTEYTMLTSGHASAPRILVLLSKLMISSQKARTANDAPGAVFDKEMLDTPFVLVPVRGLLSVKTNISMKFSFLLP
jgi:hypothetical protein